MQPVQSSPVNLYNNNNNNSNVVSNPWSYPQTQQQQSQQQPTTADPFGSLLWKKWCIFLALHNTIFPLFFYFTIFFDPKKGAFITYRLLDWVLHPAQILGLRPNIVTMSPTFTWDILPKFNLWLQITQQIVHCPLRGVLSLKNNVMKIHGFGCGGISHGCESRVHSDSEK